MMIVAGDPPDFRTISDFRKRHLKALAALFVQVLQACREGRAGEARARGARRHQDQGERVQTQGDELRAHEEAGSGVSRPRSIAGSRPPKPPMRRRTGLRQTSAATRCRTGWPTSRSGAKIREAKAELEAEAKAAAAAETRGEPRRRSSVSPKAARRTAKTPAPPSAEPDRNCGCFYAPGNRVGLPGLDGGGCRDRTDGHRSLASLQNEAARRGFHAEKRFVAANVKVARGQTEGANYQSLFARKPQISLAFVPLNSNGRDVLKGAQAPAGVTRR